MSAHVPVIVITGSMGSGKTTILGEASDLLTERRITHAGIDLDTLGIGHVSEDVWTDLAYRNLSSVWQNYAAAGATRLLLAEAVESVGQLKQIRDAVAGAEPIVCRLTARLATMRQRVEQRERGILRQKFVARVAELEALLEAVHLEDFSLATDQERSVTDTALEMLKRANWIS